MKRSTALIAAVVTLIVAGCSSATDSTAGHGTSSSPASSASPPAGPAAHGVEAPIGTVPWPQVGPGWLLATWSPVSGGRPGEPPAPGEPTSATATTTLYLVDPAGGRYAITTLPPPGDMAGARLVDWSGDGGRALFYAEYAKPPVAIVVDLHTGAQTKLVVDGRPRFTRPDGGALLLETPGHSSPPSQSWPGASRPGALVSADLSGNHLLTYPVGPDFSGGYLSTPDGTRLVLGRPSGFSLMGNDGITSKTVSIQGQKACSPLRWWDGNRSTTVLMRCTSTDGSGTRLWLVPINGDAPTALTAPNDGQKGPDFGDADAWQLASGTFVQALAPCGVTYLAKLNADGTTSQVAVPDVSVDGSVFVVGANRNDLQITARAGCGGSEALVTYDTTEARSTVLLGPPVNGGDVVDVLPYPGQG
jgi:TolB protein